MLAPMTHIRLILAPLFLGTLAVSGQLAAQTAPVVDPSAPAETPSGDPAPRDVPVSDAPTTEASTSDATGDAPENEPSPETPPIVQSATVSSQVPLGDPEPAIAPAEPAPTLPTETAHEPSYESSPEPERPKKEVPSPFRQWSISLGLGLGWASSGSSNWTILGAGAGVFVVDGLKLGFDSTFWVGDKPFIATTTPSLTYIFHMVPVVHPYLGAFYRHYFVDSGYSDTDSLGGRGGVYFVIGRHLFIGGGIVYEHFLDDNLFTSRNDVYPEISFTFAF